MPRSSLDVQSIAHPISSRRRPSHQVGRVALAAAIAIQLGNCYRVEIDLTPLVDTKVVINETPEAAGAAPGESGSGARGGADALVSGVGGAGGGGGLTTSGGAGEGGAEGGQAGGGAAGDGGGTPINQGGACYDEPRTVEHEVCHITGVKPGVKECAEPDDSEHRWRGCYDGGCSVCTLHGQLPGYPYYFDWHPCCSKNDTCSNHEPFVCNALCPAPTEHDKVEPCGKRDPNITE